MPRSKEDDAARKREARSVAFQRKRLPRSKEDGAARKREERERKRSERQDTAIQNKTHGGSREHAGRPRKLSRGSQASSIWSPSSRARVAVDMLRCGASTCGAHNSPVCHIQSPSSRACWFILPAGAPLLFQLCIRDIRAGFHFVLQCSTCSAEATMR